MSEHWLHPEAFIDSDEIAQFIGYSSEAAHGIADEFFHASKLWFRFHREHRRPDLTGRPLRFIRVRDYPIAYVQDKKPLRNGGDPEKP